MSAQAESGRFSPDGGNGTIRVTTARECTWSARSEAPWVLLTSGASGQGDGVVGFRVSANNAPEARNAAIVVNESRQQISQDGRPCRFDLSSEREIVAPAGGERTIEVTASSEQCGWTARASESWIAIVDGREGHGSGRVHFTVAPATGLPRAAEIEIAGVTVRIEQGTGCAFTVTPSSINVTATGGDQEIRIEATSAECPWSVASNAPWITTVGAASGAGTATVRIRLAATDGPPRAGTLTVAGQTVRIEQGTGCTVNVNPASADVPAQGGTVSIAVASGAGCTWSASATQDWISITSGTQGSGPGRVDVAVASNSGPARSASVSVGSHVVAISQATGCTYSIAPTEQSIGGAGGTGTVSVTTAAGCPWTSRSNAGWITLSSTSGTGPGDVRLTAAANDSPSRTGTIAVAGHTFTVTQASTCTYTMLPPFHGFGAAGGNGNVLVIVSGPCTWTAVPTVDWIQMTAGTSGRGDGLVQFTVPPNSGPPRTGFVMIAGQQYRVAQGGT